MQSHERTPSPAVDLPLRQRIAVAIVERDGQFLVGVRPPGGALAGYSEFPGGKALDGETPADAAVRECREETGLEVVVEHAYPVVEYDYPHGRLAIHFFRCRVRDMRTTIVAPPFRWVDRKELVRLQFPEANRSLLAELVESRR